MAISSRLHDGYRRFRAERFSVETERYKALVAGQKPETMVVGCADSRVDPATIFSASPGELFILRNVAALVPPYEETGTYHGTSAALEYAVRVLRVSTIVVLGHGLCGGVEASLSSAENGSVGRFIAPWVELLSEVRDNMIEQHPADRPEDRQRNLEHLAVKLSMANMLTFPFVREAVDRDELTLEGAWFSIAEGLLLWLDKASGEFRALDD